MGKWKGKHAKSTWKTMVAGLACVVAVSTTCALILPATAMDQTCGLEEHQHSQQCYVQISGNQEQEKNIPAEEQEANALVENAEVQDISNSAIESEESVSFENNEELAQVKDENVEWKLVCQIPEHTHTAACNIKQEEVQPEIEADAQPDATIQPPEQEEKNDSFDVTDAEAEADADLEEDDASDAASTNQENEAEPDVILEEEPSKTPIDVSEYVVKATLKYKEKSGTASTNWKEMQPGVPIPGDAKLRLDINYEHVSIPELIASGCQLSFQIPKVMRNPVAQGDIQSDNERVGTITVADNVLTMTFNLSWLEKLQNSSDGFLVGDFFVESDINLSEIPTDAGGIEIVFGDVHINPTFDTDLIAKYGKLEVEKTVSKHVIAEDNVHCLEYTLTVKAGVDGSPDVKVVDYFEINGQYAEYINISTTPVRLTGNGIPREQILDGQEHGEIYRGAMPTASVPIPQENNTEIVGPGSLVWKIGNMDANEQRTLTYRVKLTDHSESKNDDQPLRNKAIVYSKTYKKNDSVADFTPKADLEMRKSHTEPQRNPENGSYKIPYTVWFEAPQNNNHVLGNVEVKDSLNLTNEKALPYIGYDENSFKLYPSKNPAGTPIELNKADGSSNPKLDFTEDKKSFTLSVGDMKAGTAYCLQYDLIVDAKAFGAANLDALPVKNRVVATADNAHLPSKDFIREFHDNCNIGYKNWIKKTVAQPSSENLTVTLPRENVYDATGGTIIPDRNTPESFTVPVGSYPYTITINELGDWDVTEADIKDTLSGEHVQYTGYLRVDAYDATQKGNDPLGTFVESHWVKIHERKSFQFRLSDIGFSKNSYAYRFTYYVSPVNIGGISKVVVNNTANITGTVGKDGEKFQIGEFGSKVEITIHGGHAFEARKYPWYYENSKVSTGVWSKGAIYWGIKIDGSELHKGSWIRDFVKTEHPHPERGKIYFRNDSFVGIYKGKLPDGVRFDDYGDLQSLVNSGYVTELPTDVYCNVFYEDRLNFNQENTYSDVYIEIKENISLEDGNSVFLIVKTEPDPLPTGTRTKKDYTNYLDIGDSKESMVGCGLATKHLYGGQNILKEFNRFIQFDGEKITNLQTGKPGDIPKHLLHEPGHYISWASKVNYGGDLSGRYRVVDEIPEGTEIAFVRQKWLGNSIRNQNIRMHPIENYQQVLGEGWTEHRVSAAMDQAPGPFDSYYYTNGNKVLWEVGDLIAGHKQDNYAVDFQIVCRVTDPEVLQGGANKEFVNQIFLQHMDGTQLDSSSSGVKVSVSNIDKSAQSEGNSVHFSIALNPAGEDLIKDGDTVTLVDEMSETLSLDVESIRVFNSITHDPVKVKASLDEQTLIIVMPDNQPLTVTYTAHIHAVPDSFVTLSNNAYWMGYAPKGGDSVLIENFHYKVGGTAGGIKSPQVHILKFDKNDILHRLEGAEFRMEEGTMEDGIFKGNGNVWTGTTGSDGMLTFGVGDRNKHQMHYNEVYCITETHAPEGYILDKEPQYFIIAAKVGDHYPDYPDGVHVHYASAVHTLKAPNSKGEAYVQKKFQRADATPVNVIPGQYRFGLFDNAQGEGKSIQVVTLNFTETTNDSMGTFVDLKPDQTYYVFELDEAMNPILPGNLGYVNATPFQVEYSSDHGSGVQAVTNGGTVTVTNRLCVESLPETGGFGTRYYTFAGLVLLCSGIWFAYRQFKKAHTESKC